MEIMIQVVSGTRRRFRKIIATRLCGVPSGGDWRRRLNRHWTGPASKRRVAVPVNHVQNEPNQEPPPETHPREMREPSHDEHAEQCPNDSHYVHEWYSEGPRPLWIGVAKHDHSDAHQREGEQRSDIREIVRLPGVANQRPQGDKNASQQRCYIRGPIFPVDFARPVWQQSVASHGEEDARLTVLEHE